MNINTNRKANGRALRRLLWSAAGLITLAIVSWIALDVATGLKLRHAISDWQEAGLHLNVWDVVPPSVPSEENAAVVLSRVVQLRSEQNYDRRLLDRSLQEADIRLQELAEEILECLLTADVDPDSLNELDDLLRFPPIAYRLLTAKEAAEFERFDPYLQWNAGLDLTLPHIGGLRSLARFLQAEAIARAAHGDWANAYPPLLSILQLGHFIRSEPLLISKLTGRALDHITLTTLETFLQIQPPSADLSQRLQDRLEAARPGKLDAAVLVDATAMADLLYQNLKAGKFAPSQFMGTGYGNPIEEYRQWLDKGIFRPLHKLDYATYLDVTRERILLVQQERSSFETSQKISKLEDRLIERIPWYAAASAALIPSTTRIYLQDALTEARLELASVALAANAYRAKSGDWPDRLEYLVPQYIGEIPRDPFINDSIRYLRQENRVLLYSVGPDMQDDGGEPMERTDRPDSGDVLWLLEREK